MRITRTEKIGIIFLFVFLLYVGYLSVFTLGEQSLWIDEGYSINSAKAILDRGVPILDSGQMYGKGILSSYTIAFSMKVFGFNAENPWSARLPSVVFGVGLLVMLYIFVKKIFESRSIALVSIIFLGLSTWQIAWMRQVRGYTGMQLFVVVSLYFLYKWYTFGKYRDLILSVSSLIAAILFHPSATVFIIPLCVVVLYRGFTTEVSRDGLVKILTGFILLFVSIILFFTFKEIPFVFKGTHAYIDFLRNNFTVIVFGVFLSLGCAYFDQKNRKIILIIAAFIFIPICIFSVYRYSVQERYLLGIFPLLIILCSYTIVSILTKLFKIKSEIFVTLMSVFVLFSFNSGKMTWIPQKSYVLEKGSPQPNFKEAYSVIKNSISDDDVVISPYTHLTKIYLNNSGVWIPISLTSNRDEIARHTINGKDYYTGAPKIDSLNEFTTILQDKKGFFVLDGLAQRRLGRKTMEVFQSIDPNLIYHSGEGINEMWVFGFK